jgi:glycosyltransferase involved in cell wall biosynthesis
MKLLYALGVCSLLYAQQPEKPFVIVITSYNNNKTLKFNNKNCCIENIRSALNQKYTNYRISFTDDASSDGTYNTVYQDAQTHSNKDKITFTKNTYRRGALANQYQAIHNCKPEEIIVHLDGDDILAHEHVLAQLNSYYQDPQIWLTYGRWKSFPDDQLSDTHAFPTDIIASHSFRKYPFFLLTHIRTYYACLFHHIKLEDFCFEGDWWVCAADAAYMYPIVEMAAQHHMCAPEILYFYNKENELNDHKNVGLQEIYWRLHNHFTHAQPYNALSILPITQNTLTAADVLIISAQTPSKTDQIKIITQKITGVRNIFTISEANLKQEWEKIKHQVTDYVLCISSTSEITQACNLAECINFLQQTRAACFFLHIGVEQAKNMKFMDLRNNIYAWHHDYASAPFARVTISDGIITHKNNISLLLTNTDDYKFTSKINLCYQKAVIDKK